MYDKKLKEYKSKQFDITQQVQEHSKADENHYLTASRLLDVCKRAKEIFNRSEPNEKRELLNFILQNSRLNGKTPMFTLKPVFAGIVAAHKNASWLDVVAEVRKAIREHDGYIYIPDLKPKGEVAANVSRVTTW